MEKLKELFEGTGEVKGFLFKKVYESETGYIYQVQTSKHNRHFEVFKKKTAPKCIDFEKRIYDENDRKEVYPKSKDFGRWAWTVGDVESGKERIKQWS